VRYAIMFLVAIMFAGFFVSQTMSKEEEQMGELKLSSFAFQDNGDIPQKYTCDGIDVNPPLKIDNVPSETKSLALIVDDPDAPMGTWVHWIVWNIDPKTTEIKEDTVPQGALQGVNDFRKNDYGGPCPPSGRHRYFFKLYALDTILNRGMTAKKADIERAMKGHILAEAQIIGLYRRS